jgi:hypothetical protein
MLKSIGHREYDNVGTIDSIGMGRLAKAYSRSVIQRRASDARNQEELRVSIPHMHAIQKKLAEAIREPDEVSGHLPVASVFDALQVVKARRDLRRNPGLRALRGHLQSAWKKNRTANLSANTFLNLKDYYIRNYPKSGMSEVFDDIAKGGYFTLPISELLHIASQIGTQEDFDHMMVQCGLSGTQPHQVKSRNFILASLNGEDL